MTSKQHHVHEKKILFFQVKFSAKLDPDDLVTFKLRYEELLERSDGKYRYEINIQPKNAPITSAGIDIKVMINETLPLKRLSIKRLIQRNPGSKPIEISENRDSLRKTSPKNAHFNYIYSPAADQVKFGLFEKHT